MVSCSTELRARLHVFGGLWYRLAPKSVLATLSKHNSTDFEAISRSDLHTTQLRPLSSRPEQRLGFESPPQDLDDIYTVCVLTSENLQVLL